MAVHAHHKRDPQNNGNGGTGQGGNGNLLASITFNSAAVPLTPGSGIATAQITTYTSATSAFVFETTVNGEVLTMTTSNVIPITNSAVYASMVSAESASTASSETESSTAAAKASSSSSSDTSSNLATLIPAIVVPIVVVLCVSFGAFWFWMRRRHKKELQNTDFAMAGKGEKLSSRSNSSRSGTGTHTVEKSFDNTQISQLPSTQLGHDDVPRNSFDVVGLSHDRDAHSRNGVHAQSPVMPFSEDRDRGYQNFSGPRPHTSRRPPPSRGEQQGRNRSNSSPGNRGPPPPGYRSPAAPQGIGSSPILRNHASPPLGHGQARPLSPHSQPRPAPNPPGSGRLRAPSPSMNRSNPPTALAPAPTGAYNGASSISQYSPIVKETPAIGTVAAFGSGPPKPASRDGSRPPPIVTTDLTSRSAGLGPALAATKEKSRSPSPRSPEESYLTEENMRIARLANSSRLGFNQTSKPTSPTPASRPPRDFSKPLGYKKNGQDSPLLPINTAQSAPGQSPAATSTTNPSPKLPPPATLSQLIPSDSPRDERKPQWNYFGNSQANSPVSSPHMGHSLPLPASRDRASTSNRGHDNDNDNHSEISDLDGYEDIDAKSDVSSLNEFERFDFDSRHGSRPGSSNVHRGSAR